jgi:hypothetical protein
MPPISKPWPAAFGMPSHAANHAADEDPGRGGAGRFPPRPAEKLIFFMPAGKTLLSAGMQNLIKFQAERSA